MTETPKSSYFWIFTEDDLNEALWQFAADLTDDVEDENDIRRTVLDFLNSRQVINRGMRRGGDTESEHD